MLRYETAAEPGTSFSLFVVVRRGRLALGKKLSATDTLRMLRSQQGGTQ